MERRNRRRAKEEEGGCLAGRPPCEHTLILPSFSLTQQLATSTHLKPKADEDKTRLLPIPLCFSISPPSPSPPLPPSYMDHPSSECTSAADSGWTLYLQHSFAATRRPPPPYNTKQYQKQEEQEEEDLSMVSDASSGPPHLEEDDDSCFYPFPIKTCERQNPISINHKQQQQQKQKQKQKHSSVLDDTASSHASDFTSRKKDNASSTQHQTMAAAAAFSSAKVIRR